MIKVNLKCEPQIKCLSSINEFVTGKKSKKKSIIKELISEARQRESKLVKVKQPINYDHIINDKFIETYNSLRSKMTINAYALFTSENFDKTKGKQNLRKLLI